MRNVGVELYLGKDYMYIYYFILTKKSTNVSFASIPSHGVAELLRETQSFRGQQDFPYLSRNFHSLKWEWNIERKSMVIQKKEGKKLLFNHCNFGFTSDATFLTNTSS